MRLPYPLVCAVLGLFLGWLPKLAHGPIPEKFNHFHSIIDGAGLNGALLVWAFYAARLLIGVMVGISHRPTQWWLRGPLCGLLMMLPVTIVSLATPLCGPPCMGWNLTSAALVGLAVAGLAFLITGKDHA